MDELISIIIPAYNIQDYLGATIESVLAQTHENLQIIVVDDGSGDQTAEVIKRYAEKDSRIKMIRKENGGVTSARLRGIQEAVGSYVGFVDGDDYIEPQMYEKLLKNAKEHNADIAHCGYQMVFPAGRVEHYYNTGKIVVQDDLRGCKDLLEAEFIEPALYNKLYRRQLFDGLESWMDLTIRINEDLLMNFYLFRQAKTAVFEDRCLYHYMLRKGSAATSKLNEYKLWDPLKVLRRLAEETKEVPQWNQIVQNRLTYQLVCRATMSLSDQADLIRPCRDAARRELRKRLYSTLTGGATLKLKVMTLWVSVWPASYGWVHNVYARLTGVDKKYEIES